MEILIALLAGAIGAILAAILAFANHFIKKKKRAWIEKEIRQINRALFDTGMWATYTRAKWIKDIEDIVAVRLASSAGIEKKNIHKEIEKQMVEIRDRVSLTEAHFPANANFERTFSINDTLLSEKIDQLALRLDAIEERNMTKLEISIIVAEVVSIIAFLGSISYAIITFLLV